MKNVFPRSPDPVPQARHDDHSRCQEGHGNRCVQKCPHMKETGSTWDQDFYACDRCGETAHTNDDDMK